MFAYIGVRSCMNKVNFCPNRLFYVLSYIVCVLSCCDAYVMSPIEAWLQTILCIGYNSLVFNLLSDHGSDRRPNLAKEFDAAGELYIPQKSWPYSSFFIIFFCMVSMHIFFLFNTSIVSLGTDERIAKIRVSKCPILKFVWDFEKCQNGHKSM